MIPRPSAREIEQLPLSILNLLKISVIANGFNAHLERNDLIVTGHHDHGAQLQALCPVHGAWCLSRRDQYLFVPSR